MDEVLGIHLLPQFYGVYILQSQPKPKAFYIGSTPDPQRRLNQHNGVNVGGAYKTKRDGFRPWDMVVLVHGFPLKIAALQFEHALQHAHQTRHIVEKLNKSVSIHVKLANVRLLMNSKLFRLMGLQVAFFKQEIYQVWEKNRYKIEVDSLAELHQFDQFVLQVEQTNEELDKLKKQVLFENNSCPLCQTNINYLLDLDPISSKIDLEKTYKLLPLISRCGDCNNVFHLTCLSKMLDELIPTMVVCQCGVELNWKLLVGASLDLRYSIVNEYLPEK